MDYLIKTSSLHGHISVPPSKSHTLRAILFAALADGVSHIHNYLPSPDTNAMIHACRLLGASIDIHDSSLQIAGVAGKPQAPKDIIDAGNSGQVLRFIGAIAGLIPAYTVITGDHSIRTSRPVQPLLDGLNGLNVFAVSTKGDQHAPIIIKGPIQPGSTTLNGEDSQPVSGLLIAAAFAPGITEIHVNNPGETPWIELTLDWLKRLGIRCEHSNYTYYKVTGNAVYPGFDYVVPGDFSSAAFPIVAALITHSEITIHNLDMQDVQGDKEIITVLKNMGAEFDIDTEKKIVHVKNSQRLTGQTINVNHIIDAVPILAVAGTFATGQTQLIGAKIARQKESDRLAVIARELNKMGAKINVLDDGLIIEPAKLSGAIVASHHDHRIAMSLVVAGFAASHETVVEDIHCIAKSYPDFAKAMQTLGARLKVSA